MSIYSEVYNAIFAGNKVRMEFDSQEHCMSFKSALHACRRSQEKQISEVMDPGAELNLGQALAIKFVRVYSETDQLQYNIENDLDFKTISYYISLEKKLSSNLKFTIIPKDD